MKNHLEEQISSMYIKPGSKPNLDKMPTAYDKKKLDKAEAAELMAEDLEKLKGLQEKLYGTSRYSVLLVIQAMDAAGKDSMVGHIMSGLNPTGVKVTPFGVPSKTEHDHDYLWRHNLALPGRGEIGIFVRSHYENVLVTRVHPEFLMAENLPGIEKPEDVKNGFWEARYRQINDWERYLHENGCQIVKVFLHSSLEEQQEQLLERIDDPEKQWKFNYTDIKERAYWPKYRDAYEELLSKTSTEYAPWYVIPADNRWFTRACVASILRAEIEKLPLRYPPVTEQMKLLMQQARVELLGGNPQKPGK